MVETVIERLRMGESPEAILADGVDSDIISDALSDALSYLLVGV